MSLTITYANLATVDLGLYKRIAVANDSLSYVLLWKGSEALSKMYAPDAPADVIDGDQALLIIQVANADDPDVRRAVCDQLRPRLAARRGTAVEGWVGLNP